MKRVHTINLLRCLHRPLRSASVVALLLGASNGNLMFAQTPRWLYVGKDAAAGITVALTVVGTTPATFTGSMYDGNPNCSATVTGGMILPGGTASGGAITGGEANYKLGGLPAASPVTGTLTGVLGASSSTLEVMAFMPCNVVPVMVVAMLHPQPPIAPQPFQPPAGGTTVKPVIILPASETMTGHYSLGTTWSETLMLTTKLQGSSYDVAGTITVDQFISCPLVPNCQPHSVITALSFSGVLTPGVQGQLTINDAPAGSTPAFYGTISSTGTSFSGAVEGMPSIGITFLAVIAAP